MIKPEPLSCEECRQEFQQCRNKTKRFCSEGCRARNHNRRYAHERMSLKVQKEREQYQCDPEYRKKVCSRVRTRYHLAKCGVCDHCNKKKKTHWHHITYEPITAIELCVSCHRHLHERLKKK